MSKKREFLPDEINEMVRLYNEEKMGTPAIGLAFGVGKGVINRALKRSGIKLDISGRRNIGGRAKAQKKYDSKPEVKIKKLLNHKEWRKDKQGKLKEYHKEWRDENRDVLREKQAAYQKKRCSENPKYRLGSRTRTALWTCLKERNVAKYRSTFDLLGYTLEELMVHLEKQFTEGMTWENYGEWHVDHKIPMAKFVFESTDDREFHLCWSLDNLQPLWANENLLKGSKSLYF